MNTPKLRFPEQSDPWTEKKLGEVAQINPSNKKLPDSFIYIDLESVEKGRLLKENLIFKKEAPSRAQRLLTKDDILFQMVRPYQMNNLFFNKEGNYVASTGYAQIRTAQNSKYLYQYLHYQKFVDKVIEKCTGTSYPAINSTDLSNIQISFPTLSEQTKIANFLTAVDEKLQSLKSKKGILELYKKGVMQKLFSQELRFKDENGKSFPEWRRKTFGEVAERIGDGLHGTPAYTENTGFYFINGNNLMNGSIVINETTKEVDLETYNKNIKGLNENTLLISINGTIGNVARYQNEKVMLGKSVGYFNFKENTNFYYYLLTSDNIQKKFISELTGSTIKNLSLKTLREAEFLLPSLPEQTRIAHFLSYLEKKIYSINEQVERMEAWKNGLLQKMFC